MFNKFARFVKDCRLIYDQKNGSINDTLTRNKHADNQPPFALPLSNPWTTLAKKESVSKNNTQHLTM